MDILILGVLGDILGFNNGAYKINRYKVTKQLGDGYIIDNNDYFILLIELMDLF
jgi:hypothetical protein